MPPLSPDLGAGPSGALPDYQTAVRYLESFIKGSSEPPLDRDAAGRARMSTMQALMSALGNPHRAFRSVHVGGTSGKGSTSTLIAAALQAGGYRTGLHTTPYLQQAVEKLVVDGQPIAPADLVALVEDLKSVTEVDPALTADASFVQRWTALTFMHFARRSVECAVVEVSLGGRYDATNVLQPEVSVITNIGHDHLAALGPEISDVAWNKAGIIKTGIPAVTAATQPEALRVMEREAAAMAAPLWVVGRDVVLEHAQAAGMPTRIRVHTPCRTWENVPLSLSGAHQATNAATALATLDLLAERGLPVPETAVRNAFAHTSLPGRFETVQQRPLVILDGAHNPEKASSLRATLDGAFPGRRVTFVLGVGATKELPDILAALMPVAQHVVCTEAAVIAKPAVPSAGLAATVRGLGVAATVEPDPLLAVETALSIAGEAGIVCVTGSMYLVGLVRGRWFPAAALVSSGLGG